MEEKEPPMDSSWETETNWIWHPDWIDAPHDGKVGGIVLFHRTVVLSRVPSVMKARVTADTRYRLFINGTSVCIGPPKGDEKSWFFDELDIAPYFKSGENVIAVRVLRYFFTHVDSVPFARLAYPGFFFCASHGSQQIKSDSSWLCRIDDSVTLKPQSFYDVSLQIYEDVDGLQAPQSDWLTTTKLNDGRWTQATEYKWETNYGGWAPWILTPSSIPRLIELPRKFSGVVQDRSDHVQYPALPSITTWNDFLNGRGNIQLPANAKCSVDIEYFEHVTGFLHLAIVAGTGKTSHISLLSAECYEYKPRIDSGVRCKGDRRDFKNGDLLGVTDEYHVRGDDTPSKFEIFEPFWFRTFRFIRFDIETYAVPLELHEFIFLETGYPLQELAQYHDEKTDPKFWTVSLRTLKNCMHDSYEDCPFYEQLTYAMDTRSEILFSYYVSGDDRLARNAITHFHNGLQPDGLTFSRSPAHRPQIIPGFSLYWILMIYDHLQYFCDLDFARRFTSSIDAVLGFFDRHIDPTVHLVGVFHQRYWAFIDSVENWPFGVPPAYKKGHATYFSLLYVYVLEKAAIISRQVGRPMFSGEYLGRARKVRDAVNVHCYNGLYYTDCLASMAEEGDISQHTQIWAILAKAAGSAQAVRLVQDMFQEENISKFSICSYPMTFYMFRALATTPLYGTYFDQLWQPWKMMLRKNLTTWEESKVDSRSDCHAWSCLPLYEFPAEILGLKPALPGWKCIAFQPRLLIRDHVKGKIPIPGKGMASVEWTVFQSRYRITLEFEQPADVIVILPDGEETRRHINGSVHIEWTK